MARCQPPFGTAGAVLHGARQLGNFRESADLYSASSAPEARLRVPSRTRSASALSSSRGWALAAGWKRLKHSVCHGRLGTTSGKATGPPIRRVSRWEYLPFDAGRLRTPLVSPSRQQRCYPMGKCGRLCISTLNHQRGMTRVAGDSACWLTSI